MKKELWLIWKAPETRRRFKIGILTFENERYIFKYVNPELNDAINFGFVCFPGFENINEIYRSDELFTNIETRLPNTYRKDYLEILNLYNLDQNSSKFEILKATKGRLLTDNYEFVQPFDSNKIEFNVAGTRHYLIFEEVKKIISVNDKLLLELDSNNQYDDNAIKVILKKDGKEFHIGYVPRFYSKELSDLLKRNIEYSAMIQSLNFESELNDEKINAYVKLIFNNKENN